MANGSVRLGEVAARQKMLEMSCSRCDRRGRLRVDKLLKDYGPDFAMPDLAAKLSVGCTKKNGSAFDRCPVRFQRLLDVE